MAGLYGLSRIQIGREVVEGIPATCTYRLIGKITGKHNYNFYRPSDQMTGLLSEYTRSECTGKQAELTFESDFNYQQSGVLLAMTLLGGVHYDPVTYQIEGSYRWVFSPDLSDNWAPDTYSFEFGDNEQAYLSCMCFGKTLQISGSVDSAVMISCSMYGKDIEKTVFTSGIENPYPLECAKTDLGKVFIDNSWDNLGKTLIPATVIDFSINWTEGLEPVKYLNGNLYASAIAEKKRHCEIELTIAHNSVYKETIWDAFIDQSYLFVRLEFPGSGPNDLIIEGCFIVDNPDSLSETNSQSTLKIRLISIYDSMSDHEWCVTLINDPDDLPVLLN